MAKASWVIVSKESGSGNGSFTISASEHTGRSSRSSSVTVSAPEVTPKTISVAQNGTGNPTLTVTNDTEELIWAASSVSGDYKELTGTSNGEAITFSIDDAGRYFDFYNHSGGNAKFLVNGSECVSGVPISGDPGATSAYTWSLRVICKQNAPVSTSPINGKLTITVGTGSATKQISINLKQTGTAPSLSVSPTSVTLNANPTPQSISVTSNTSWTVS